MGKFKVGDRVKYKDAYVDGVGTIHSSAAGEGFEWMVAVAPEHRDRAYYFDETCRAFSASNLAPAPATLTIEAGRYYKTRDGRKVGPIVANPYHKSSDPRGDGPFRANHWNYDANGVCSNLGGDDPKDLIAEWQEPAATAAVVSTAGAQVDALAEEYGPTPHVDPSAMIAKALGANDNKTDDLIISIGADTAVANEALDEIIKKLKKIRKLQREVGIAA